MAQIDLSDQKVYSFYDLVGGGCAEKHNNTKQNTLHIEFYIYTTVACRGQIQNSQNLSSILDGRICLGIGINSIQVCVPLYD